MPTRQLREPAACGRLLWQLLTGALDDVTQSGRSPLVLDCGGGSGRFAVPLAEMGADVTVIDISADALATLRRRAADAGVGDRIRAVQGDVENVTYHVAGRVFDLGLAHELLEAVDDPAAALGSIAAAVRPAGLLSVLVVNPIGQVLARVLAGDLSAAREELRRWANGAPVGLGLAAVTALCEKVQLTVEQAHGIGVFADLLPDPDADPRLLADLEELAAARAPYRDIAARFHVIARRPAG